MTKDERPTVYSTAWEENKPCPLCKQIPCRCQQKSNLPPSQQTALVRRETKGRGGKSVTTISNLNLDKERLKDLAKIMKKSCNTGGTIKNNVIEIQGDQREKVQTILLNLGYKVKLAGG